MVNNNRIFTNDNCVGCNKCIAKCPCDEANVARIEGDKHKVYVDDSKCIACSECLRVCTHNARDYTDDTERFLTDLESGNSINIIAAPSLRSNVPDWQRLIGYLKSSGVPEAYDTSYGADICTWAYLRYISANNAVGLISQPCPAIVNYIERYVPEHLNRLAPIHSPAMCTAVYMSKYMNIPGPYAFLSPCVAKCDEFNDPNTGGLIGYNVTFKKLLEQLLVKGVDYRGFEPAGYDNDAHGLGSVYSSPGGLKTNVERHVQDEWIFQIEGQPYVSQFLNDYAKEKGDVPFLVDILNCMHGCNVGTGAYREFDEVYDVGRVMHKVQKESMENKQGDNQHPGPCFDRFDKELDLSDFKRRYTPKKITPMFVDRAELDAAFAAMHKPTHDLRVHDCRRCGFTTCQEMAVAIAKGLNHKENCIDYYRGELKQVKP